MLEKKYTYKTTMKGDERLKEFLKLRNSGLTLQQIADKNFGITRERVRQLLIQAEAKLGGLKDSNEISKNIKIKKLDKKLEKYQELIIIFHEQNMTVREISKEMGLSYALVRDLINRLEKKGLVKINKVIRRNVSERTKYVREKIIELRDKNYKLDTIAAELGITKPAISRHISLMRAEGIYVPGGLPGRDYSEYEKDRLHKKVIIERLLEKGLKKSEIAEKMGIKVSSLSRFIRLYIDSE